MADYELKYIQWSNALTGTQYAPELEKLAQNPAACEDSFYTDLEFGTAGMRGILGLGTNRMNIFTIRQASKGLANYINSEGKAAEGVAIAYDTRLNSDVFAKETAGVLVANGIKVYLYTTPHSVPQLSFAVLHLKCAAGVVITASHNPPEYNGYKVYGEDGGQATTAFAAQVTKHIQSIEDVFGIDTADISSSPLCVEISSDLDELYYEKVEVLAIHPELIKKQAASLNIVYTPLYGTGLVPVTHVLNTLGIKNLHVVAEQRYPDPAFPTVSAPNPENRESFDLAIKLAQQEKANLILATDPDSDRLGIAVCDGRDDFTVLSGNQIGCLLLEYILSQKKDNLRPGDFVVKSLVSTEMADVIAAQYGVELRDVYTGFKFIAEQIKLSEQTGCSRFLFGFEESYGYLLGTFTRDKDAIQAAMLVADAASYYAENNKTIYDAVMDLYEKYGWFSEVVLSHELKGQEGSAKINAAVESLRNSPPEKIGSFKINAIRDYRKQTRTDLVDGSIQPINKEPMNILYFELEQGRMIVRPSGTEPKLKIYLTVRADAEAASTERLSELQKEADALLDGLLQ